MPYSSIANAKKDSFPTTAGGVPLTIAQINHLARIHDGIKESGAAENPMAAAWKQWKNIYKKEGDKWVKKETKASEHSIRYFDTIELKEGEYPEKIQLLKLGNWKHPKYGEFKITQKDLVKFKESHDNDVRKVELALDAEHFPEKGAAAWVKELIIEGDKLFAEVEWTDWGKEIIDKKLFKYISPEFNFEYTDLETDEKYNNVLFGAALTNRPFIKGMQPVLLSESISKSLPLYEMKTKGGSKKMELKELLKAIGLKEDATIEDVQNKIKELKEGKNDDNKELKELRETLELKEDATKEDITTKLNDLKKKAEGKDKEGEVTLAEKRLKELEEDAKKGKDAMEKLKLNERDKVVSKAIRAGKIVPAQKEWAETYALNDPKGFGKFVENAPKAVKTKEEGSQREGMEHAEDEEEARKQLNERAKTLLDEKKADNYNEALDMAVKEQEDK